MKLGIKTSEFWVTMGVAALKYFVPTIPDELVGLGAAYVISRGVAKAGKVPVPTPIAIPVVPVNSKY